MLRMRIDIPSIDSVRRTEIALLPDSDGRFRIPQEYNSAQYASATLIVRFHHALENYTFSIDKQRNIRQ